MKKRFFDILVNIKYWLLYVVWSISTKRKEVIDGHEIYFLPVSKYFIWGFDEGNKIRFSEGFCLVKKQKLMIFLNHKECKVSNFRYTLLHEYIEGNYLLEQDGIKDGLESKLKPIYKRASEEMTKNFPFLLEAIDVSWEKDNKAREHILALVIEFDLASREMTPDRLTLFVDDMIKNRL
ncbi:MAG: hypothetical protein V4665_00135 [Patescibacteria group bacterium]